MTLPYLYQEVDRIYAKTLARGVRTLCVTSSICAEGTTSVVCALAQRATAVNLKVLIVDLNLNNPVVSRMTESGKSDDSPLNLNSLVPNPGQNTPLPPPDWDCAISHFPVDISIKNGPGVKVIPRPSVNDNPVRFREHTMLNRMIAFWLEHHDCIIFDTSSLCLVNQRNIPPQHVATCCDAAVLVVKSGKTQTHHLKEAMEILHTVEVNLVGTVMNDYANPLLGVELVRQCQKLERKLPRLSRWMIRKIQNSPFLFADF